MVEKTATFKQRRVADTQAWRARQKRGAAVYPVEVDGEVFDLMTRLGVLEAAHADNKQAVAVALGKLLRIALAALRREINPHR
jgi:hypothetical protein